MIVVVAYLWGKNTTMFSLNTGYLKSLVNTAAVWALRLFL